MKPKSLALALVAAGGTLAFVLGAGNQPAPAGKDAVLRVGTFDSRAIAVAYAHSKYNTQVAKLMEESKKAKAANDTKKIAELNTKGKKLQDKFHLQGFGKVPVDDLLACVKDRLPAVAKEAGVDVIADDMSWAADGVAKVDVTDRLVKLYEPNEQTLKMVAEMKNVKPLPLEDFPIED
jgi:hypothetical protein